MITGIKIITILSIEKYAGIIAWYIADGYWALITDPKIIKIIKNIIALENLIILAAIADPKTLTASLAPTMIPSTIAKNKYVTKLIFK